MTNFDFEKILDTNDEWIVERTGIKKRHFVEKGQQCSDLAYFAALEALKDAKISASEIDMILVGTNSPESMFPSVASKIQDRLGAKRAGAMDIHAGCTASLSAMAVGVSGIASGMWNNVLVVGAEAFGEILVAVAQRVDQVIGVDALHGQADGLHATGNNDVAAARSDLVGGNGNRLQARRTETVESHARRTGAQLREHRHVTPDVIALGAFVGAGTDDAVFYRRRVDTVAGQQRIDTMGRHVIGTGLVELAAKGFGQAGSHAVDDHYFTHGLPRSCGCGSRIDPGLADRDDHSLRGCKSMEPL